MDGIIIWTKIPWRFAIKHSWAFTSDRDNDETGKNWERSEKNKCAAVGFESTKERAHRRPNVRRWNSLRARSLRWVATFPQVLWPPIECSSFRLRCCEVDEMAQSDCDLISSKYSTISTQLNLFPHIIAGYSRARARPRPSSVIVAITFYS